MSLVAAAGSMLLPETDFWNSFRWWMISAGIGRPAADTVHYRLVPAAEAWVERPDAETYHRGCITGFPAGCRQPHLLRICSGTGSVLAAGHLFPAAAPDLGGTALGLRGERAGAADTGAVFAVRYAVSGRGWKYSFRPPAGCADCHAALPGGMAVPTLFLTAVMGEYQREESAARDEQGAPAPGGVGIKRDFMGLESRHQQGLFLPGMEKVRSATAMMRSPTVSRWQSRVHPDDLEPTLRRCRILNHPPANIRPSFASDTKDGSYRWIYTGLT